MGILEDTIVKAKSVIDKGGKKTVDFARVQKLKMSIASFNSQISKNYEVLGRLYFDEKQNNISNQDQIDNLIEEICCLNEDMDVLLVEIAYSKGLNICEKCDKENSIDSIFCGKCGAKLPELVTECECCCCHDDSSSELNNDENCCCENKNEDNSPSEDQ